MKKKQVIYGNELYHFGIPGQKWGERRWQNEDGSLTPEGRIHYGYGDRIKNKIREIKNNTYSNKKKRVANDNKLSPSKKWKKINDLEDERFNKTQKALSITRAIGAGSKVVGTILRSAAEKDYRTYAKDWNTAANQAYVGEMLQKIGNIAITTSFIGNVANYQTYKGNNSKNFDAYNNNKYSNRH